MATDRSAVRFTRARLLVLALAACASVSAVGAQSSSTSYALSQTSTNGAGDTVASPSFRLTYTLGQAMSVATSSSPAHVLQSGFWSFVGAGSVPIVLAVDRGETGGRECDLRWSGNTPPYDVYAASDCSAVFDSFYASSSDNSLLGVTPPSGDLACFNVLSAVADPSQPGLVLSGMHKESRP